ncbi:MAG: hypothetical protein IJ608_14330 [Lachnospiraceae bacterium]|nr:hypothetical protein [Lachnospiraceae bacterium]
MTVFVLKIIAMLTMLCDHIGGEFMDNSIPMRCIGRFAFPIYAFLLAEGYRHMRNDPDRVSAHLGGYVFLALISEFCYDLLEFKPLKIEDMITSQNAIITLLIAFLGLIAIDRWKDKPLHMWSAIILTACANFFIMSNYKFVGVLLVYAFYYYLNRMENMSYVKKLAFLLGIFIIYLPIYHWARYNFCSLEAYIDKLTVANRCWYLTHIAIAFVLAGYKGELGYKSKVFNKVYKNFYPAHLLVLGIIRQLL